VGGRTIYGLTGEPQRDCAVPFPREVDPAEQYPDGIPNEVYAALLELLRILREHANERGVVVLDFEWGERIELVIGALESLQLIERSGDCVLVQVSDAALRGLVLANLSDL
jgi:hypothetical protein